MYTLVTDHGYLTEDNVIWESLDNIEGAGKFFNSNFLPSGMVSTKQVSILEEHDQRVKQMENDFLMALSLKEEDERSAQANDNEASRQRSVTDFELAKQLQEEEDRNFSSK